jgi:hypothetical protein
MFTKDELKLVINTLINAQIAAEDEARDASKPAFVRNEARRLIAELEPIVTKLSHLNRMTEYEEGGH